MNNPYLLKQYVHKSECIYCSQVHTVVFDNTQMHLEACLSFVMLYEQIYDNYLERVNKYEQHSQVHRT